jgi:hypothetical protein
MPLSSDAIENKKKDKSENDRDVREYEKKH